ncbi:hypothetical protein HID58_028839 [Brassica napus]|uniref:Uncharacterized protein n=1 Tax=Brassica napus TaxID=3708 RepID=A0ABQ8CCW6_BRANA|nr:hypothetical protein HID58_028839 [Brassica napus]
MREYILAADGGEKRVREERVRQSILDLVRAGSSCHFRCDREKGLIFDYSGKDCEKAREEKEGSRAMRVTPWLALPGLQDPRAVVVDVLQGDKDLSNPN